MAETKIGIDAGGTLIKMVYWKDKKLQFRTFGAVQIEEAATWVKEHFDRPCICLTGGKSKQFETSMQVPLKKVIEFSATCSGADHLAEIQTVKLGRDYVLANVGTGTSIHFVKDGVQERIGGTGVGGGTVMGLSYLLAGVSDFEEIVHLSEKGNRETIDLRVEDIFAGMEPPIDGSLTASNFGKIGALSETAYTEQDKIAAVIGLVAETVVTISCQAAKRFRTSSIVYIGSTFRSNTLIKKVIENYTRLQGLKPHFLIHGEFSGAVGAWLSL